MSSADSFAPTPSSGFACCPCRQPMADGALLRVVHSLTFLDEGGVLCLSRVRHHDRCADDERAAKQR
jgi:hypothetical protein